MVRKTGKEERAAYWLLIAPAVTVYFLIMAFPTVFSVLLSLSDYQGGPLSRGFNIVGFKKYSQMFADPFFWVALRNNIWVVLVSVFGQIPLGFLLAYALYRNLVRLRGFFQAVIYMPAIISTIVVGGLWHSIFSPYGPFTALMQRFNPNWQNTLFSDPKLAFLPVLGVILWMYTGMYLIIFLANLQKIDSQVIEAARIDGASELQILVSIIFPALTGVTVTSIILAISGSLKSFDLIFAMTGGGPARRTAVLSLYMYERAFGRILDYPLANAVSTFMVLVSFVLIILTKLAERKFGAKE